MTTKTSGDNPFRTVLSNSKDICCRFPPFIQMIIFTGSGFILLLKISLPGIPTEFHSNRYVERNIL